MNFLGLTLAQYVGLLAGGSIAVVIFYLLRLRRRRVAVPFGKLWDQVLMERQATSLFQRLKRLLSLMIQLILLWLLVTALSDPREEEQTREGRDIVALVDTSASMRARDVERGDGRIGEARAWIRNAIGKLGPHDRMMIVQMDARVVPLTPMVNEKYTLEKGLAQIRASDTESDFARGLRLSSDVLSKKRKSHIILLSDGRVGEGRDQFGDVQLGQAQLHWVKIGKGGRNVGLSGFSVRRYPIDRSSCEIFVEIRNTGKQDEHVELSLLGDGTEQWVRRLFLKKGEKMHLALPGQQAASQTIEARLALVGDTCSENSDCPRKGRCSGDKKCIFADDQVADDRAYAILPERRPLRVLAVSTGNLYLAAALLLDEYIDVTDMTPEEYSQWIEQQKTENKRPFDAVIFDGAPLQPPEEGNLIYLGVGGEHSPLEVRDEVEGSIWFDPIKSRRNHPVLRYVSFGDFEVYRAARTAEIPGDIVLARSEEGFPLVVVREEETRLVTMTTFALQHSDLPMRMAWPIMLMNILSWYVETEEGFVSSYKAGHPVHLKVPGESESARLCGPEGCEEIALHEGEAFFVPFRAGFYRIFTDTVRMVVAVNLSSVRESTIEPAEEVVMQRQHATEPPEMRGTMARHPWLWLLMIAVVIVLIEWMTYHRRITV